MSSKSLRLFLILALFSTPCLHAQQVVHALVGTVTHIDPSAKTITVTTADGSQTVFKDLTNKKADLSFSKELREQATAADTFAKSGSKAIVFYCGDGNAQTAVALEALEQGTLSKTSGVVVKMDRHKHLLTIQSGTAITPFEITPKTVADTSMGVTEAIKFDPQEGEQVQVTAVSSNGSKTAVFIGAD